MNYLKRAIELYKKGKLLEQSSINLKFEKELPNISFRVKS